jgi:putative transposase
MRTNYPRHLPHFTYLGPQRYFLTFCTHDRRPIFTDARLVDLVSAQILRAAATEGFEIIAYCYMSDHLHLLVEGVAEDSDLRRFVKRAKQFSGYYYSQRTGERLWQRYGYEHALRNEESTCGVVKYMLENPVRAGLVQRVTEYPHIGSGKYTRSELIEYAYGSA